MVSDVTPPTIPSQPIVIGKFDRYGPSEFPKVPSKGFNTDGMLKDYPPDYLGRKVWKAFYP